MYCWDDAKNESNREKHGIGFAAAALVFEGLVAEVQDTRTTFETRINAFGLINGRLFVCTYTPRCGWRHVISLRKANKREVKRYG
ncbi:MAG: BrnT family toxin [Alphaproteobacteria bacterium]